MNVVAFDVYKNTLKKHDGFNPVSSENNYTQLLFCFRKGDDWEKCSIITASFFESIDNIVKSNVALMLDNLTAIFTIPSDFLQNDKLKVGLQGTYTENEEPITISTNIVTINVNAGLKISDTCNQNVFEQLLVYMRSGIESNLTWINVVKAGVDNGGKQTDLKKALLSNCNNVVYYFPKGTYKCNGFEFEYCENITLIMNEANFLYCNPLTDITDSSGITCQNKWIGFKDCKNVKIVAGNMNGCKKVAKAFTFNNVENYYLDTPEIYNMGNKAASFATGIQNVNQCTNWYINRPVIHDINAGEFNGNYIYCNGIAISSGSLGSSTHGTIDTPIIYNILGYSNGDTLPDGDGIFIIQKPSETEYICESYIKIINPNIQNCSKRGIKIATRKVIIDGGFIKVNSYCPAVELQYSRGSIVRDCDIENTWETALAINWDDGRVIIENCHLKSNAHSDNCDGNGIVLNARLSSSSSNAQSYSANVQNIEIINCQFDDVVTAISTGDNIKGESYGSIRIVNPLIGYYRGENAISLHPGRISNINSLCVEGINSLRGNDKNSVCEANNTYYNRTSDAVNQDIVSIGTDNQFVNPEVNIKISSDSLKDSFKKQFITYDFKAIRKDFGEMKSDYEDVFSRSNMISFTDGEYVSATNSNFKAVVSENTITVTSAIIDEIAYIYIDIENIDFNASHYYDYEINKLSKATNLTVSFVGERKNIIDSGLEVALNANKKRIIQNISGTAKYLRIKLPKNTAQTELSFEVSIVDRQPALIGNIEARLDELEKRLG